MARLTVRVGPLSEKALRAARVESDRTIKEVADEAGISKSFLNKLELDRYTDQRYMSRKAFARLVAALRVTDPDSLLAPADDAEGTTTEAGPGAVPELRDAERAEPEEVPELRDAPVKRSA